MKENQKIIYYKEKIKELKTINYKKEDILCTVDKIILKRKKITSEFILEFEINEFTFNNFVESLIKVYEKRIKELNHN